MDAQQILKKYWNHDSFREPQEAIIQSVLEGKDAFALLPTGGGKSICFQVPAMMNPGICLVISPLIALMKDQVQNLQKRDIKAIALTGGISSDETIDLLDNCQFGNYKFLYLSPERLQSDWVLERIKGLPINLIAIDEAHCVSQWGHDFRPAYLKISKLKEHFPKVPFLALTASATQRVQDDICTQLGLTNPAVFKKSFARENIAYMVFEAEDKLFRIQQILTKNPEPSIIYVRNRKACHDVSAQVTTMGFKSTFYHGGLTQKEKEKNMQSWLMEDVQVMVATNAFGMGIDKPNVRTVIHIQLPENLENYYQEAGRAGRNGVKAFAVLLLAPSDIQTTESQFLSVLPDKIFLKEVYIKLNNYFQIGYGEGINETFSFNLNHFCQRYKFPVLKTFNAMQFLDNQGIISLSKEFSEKITVRFLLESREVIRYISLNPSDEPVVTAILRNYSGVYEIETAINTNLIARKSGTSEENVIEVLKRMHQKEICLLHSQSNDSQLTFNEVREDERTINRIAKFLQQQNEIKTKQFESVIRYVSDKKQCKSRLLLEYFGETDTKDCGICSFCITQKKIEKSPLEIAQNILALLKNSPLSSREIENSLELSTEETIFALQLLLENNKVKINNQNQYISL
ncbi:ATP-dependent DNA helicase, RecQ family [Flavobacterium enshiense DK69]|uniref:ATP-dependent DNA helicase RecQ n=1 Tax=Flavobacterium enshiense DK69 TaxID=1107311 RepID=V6SES6_9FLAO|nr:ATP-dependent DNA helicase RecQ [Flavobacterium enshiense]ESU22920.1 ATP-dependent DNA helicase, RecQ family [Flavobacterium enshiense DK69]KGO93937.1 ATP-dependent DNA helicase RecQ [Flavobacterium enshiense DK69]